MGSAKTYGDQLTMQFEDLVSSPGIIHFNGNRPWAGFVPGRAGKLGKPEWFFCSEVIRARNIPPSRKIRFRVDMLMRGIVRAVKERRHFHKHRPLARDGST